METQAFSVRLPADIHKAARLKSVRTRKTLNEIIIKKIEEWVNEPDHSTDTTKTAPKRKAAA